MPMPQRRLAPQHGKGPLINKADYAILERDEVIEKEAEKLSQRILEKLADVRRYNAARLDAGLAYAKAHKFAKSEHRTA